MDTFSKSKLLVPRNLSSRNERYRQNNMKILQQRQISFGSLVLDDNFDFHEEDVNVRTMNGDIKIDLNVSLKWLRNVDVLNGNLSFVNKYNNKLDPYKRQENFENLPKTVNGNFNCSNLGLFFLDGCPDIITGNFSCMSNALTDLTGSPKSVGGYFDCTFNYLKNINVCSYKIGSVIDFSENEEIINDLNVISFPQMKDGFLTVSNKYLLV